MAQPTPLALPHVVQEHKSILKHASATACRFADWALSRIQRSTAQVVNKIHRILDISHTSPGTPYAYTGWTPWSACSTSCGTGVQTRTQTNCTGNCGLTCGAPLNQTQPCTIGVPYYLSAWSDWSNCSQYCGSGIQTRSQTCLGTCANSSSICQGGATTYQTTSCTGGGFEDT